MAFNPGDRLGRYEVVALLGAGGMGEVYRVRDTKLGREIAVKVLPEDVAQDRGRLERFEREARLLGQLNHTNVATLYGLEESDGHALLLMELIEGETLGERLSRGPIEPEEVRELFIQIAEGLEAAHEKGIVHRDLKPANIKITPDGKVKVLDFGLARAGDAGAGDADLSQSPTLSRGVTETGVILGTAPYMSPEQARGKPVDRRTDIWAFGACLYEALARRRAFGGETVTDVLAAIVQQEPDWSVLSPMPRRQRELVQRCLRKDVGRRVQHIGDARLELEETATGEEPVFRSRARSPNVLVLAAAFGAGLAGGVALTSAVREQAVGPKGPEAHLIQLTANPAEHTVVSAALSPDGKYLAFADLKGVRVQVTATGETHEVPLPEELHVDEVDWFPDGATLLLGSSSSELWKASMFGGVPRKLAESAFGAAVSADGRRLAYLSAADSPSRQVYVMGADGEEPRPLAEGVDGESFWELAWSPDGEWLLIGTWKMVGAEKRTSIQAVHLETQERHLVLSDPRLWQDWRAVLPFIWTEAGRLVYARQELPPANRSSNLWSINIDAGAVVRGEPDRLTQLPAVNFRDLSQAAGGRVAFLAERNQSDIFVADLAGSVDGALRVTFDERDDYPAAYLRDGRTLVVLSQRGGAASAFRLDLESGDSVSLSSQADQIELAEVSWDGAYLLHRASEEWFRTPIEGGPGQLILGSGEEIHCSLAAELCVLGERDEGSGEYVFSDLDPLHGKGPERARIKDNPPFTNWDVSADGEHLAVVHNDGRIRLVNLTTGGERVIEADAWFFGEFISFAADGRAVFVDGSRSGRSARTRKSLLQVSLESEIVVEELRFRRNVWHVKPKASPDGRNLAFGAMTFTANAWMITEGE